MKKYLMFISAAALAFVLMVPNTWAQEKSTDEFMLEEITVTAEKRSANLQELPSSVAALPGDELVTQGKITTAQVLESVPNVSFLEGYETNPDGNIAIRGIQRTQASGGIDEILPATTAVYVDGIYLGIGGHYDVNRVEVLRGPQGTLYGRSATAGVVAFYTNDPKLEEFGGSASAEFGSDALINVQGALNVPVGEKVALRAAAHYYSKDGYYNPEGGKTETSEGRLKVLYQPTDALQIVVHGSMEHTVKWGGGWSYSLDGPNDINYQAAYTTPEEEPDHDYIQFGLNLTYDFGSSILTWIAGYHDYEHVGMGAEEAKTTEGQRSVQAFPTNKYHTEEIRLASDTDGRFSWLVGANYFYNEYVHDMANYQTWSVYVPEEYWGTLIPSNLVHEYGDFTNYGLFTEETLEVTDDFRITAGLRYDYTDFTQSSYKLENLMEVPGQHAYYPYDPEDPTTFAEGFLEDYPMDWHNVTYKLRFEYDMAPESMVYFTTATGFLPGYASAGPDVSPAGFSGFEYRVLDEQKLTSYELGTKNQFLNNRLRVNGSVFYYDLEGYPEVIELLTQQGHGTRQTITAAIEVLGAELECQYLMTMNDKISFSLGYQRPKITGYDLETITWTDGTVTAPNAAAVLDIQPGHPEWEATLAYDHTFNMANGSTLVPRAELHYTGDYYLAQLNYAQVALGMLPYSHQDALVLCNANLAWTSPGQKYSVNAWVRNAFDEEYKAATSFSQVYAPEDTSVTPGDPRTFGVNISAKF